MSNSFIVDYWNSQAEHFGSSYAASWEDKHMIDLEIKTIAEYIKDGDFVLDAGCSNGHATFEQMRMHKLSGMMGIDIADRMIEKAKEKSLDIELNPLCNNVSFNVGDIRSLDFSDDMFNVVYTTRVIINLPTWKEQVAAIDQCLRVTKSGGLVILSEAFWEPLQKLNAVRQLSGLPVLVEHDFNRYIKKDRLEKLLSDYGLKFTCVDFSSLYYLGSRFIRNLIVDNKYDGYNSELHDVFYKLEVNNQGAGFGIQQAYVISV